MANIISMSSSVFGFQQNKTKNCWGKGANLGELAKIEGIHVPDGFVFLLKHLKESLVKPLQLTNYLISYRL